VSLFSVVFISNSGKITDMLTESNVTS